MVDQIADLLESITPGPMGPMSPAGETADRAVAQWVGTASTLTRKALDRWRPAWSVIDHGADPTGRVDVSAVCATMVQDGAIGLFFPPGVYRLDHPIVTGSASVWCADGARIEAGADMECMLDLTGDSERHMEVRGGYWHGHYRVGSVIRSTVSNSLSVRDMFIRGGSDWQLDLSGAHGAVVSGVRIDGEYNDVGGLRTHYDSQFTHVTIHGCATGIDTQGMNMFSNVYIWGGQHQSNRRTVGFRLASGSTLIGSDLYVDGCQSGFQEAEGQYNSTIKISSLTTYAEPADVDETIPLTLFDLQPGTRLDVHGANYAANRAIRWSNGNDLDVGHWGHPFEFKTDIGRHIYDDWEHWAGFKNLDLAGIWVKPSLLQPFTLKEGQAVYICHTNLANNEDISVRSVHGDTIYRHIHAADGVYERSRDDNSNATVTLWKTPSSDGKEADLWLLNEHGDKPLWNYAVMIQLEYGYYGQGHIDMHPQVRDGVPDGSVRITRMKTDQPATIAETTMTDSIGGGRSLQALKTPGTPMDWGLAA